MAKVSKSNPKSTKQKPSKVVKKKPCNCDGHKVTKLTDDPDPCSSKTVVLDIPGPCCPCDSLETGTWGLMWRNAAGACVCLPFPMGAGTKYLKGNDNGPYWANA